VEKDYEPEYMKLKWKFLIDGVHVQEVISKLKERKPVDTREEYEKRKLILQEDYRQLLWSSLKGRFVETFEKNTFYVDDPTCVVTKGITRIESSGQLASYWQTQFLTYNNLSQWDGQNVTMEFEQDIYVEYYQVQKSPDTFMFLLSIDVETYDPVVDRYVILKEFKETIFTNHEPFVNVHAYW